MKKLFFFQLRGSSFIGSLGLSRVESYKLPTEKNRQEQITKARSSSPRGTTMKGNQFWASLKLQHTFLQNHRVQFYHLGVNPTFSLYKSIV